MKVDLTYRIEVEMPILDECFSHQIIDCLSAIKDHCEWKKDYCESLYSDADYDGDMVVAKEQKLKSKLSDIVKAMEAK
jgi:hypothetical protein